MVFIGNENKGQKMDVEKGKIMYESPPSQQSMKIKLGLTWKTKLKVGILIIIALIYTIVFVRRIIIQEQKLRNVSEMIKKMKPIIASLYEMDQKLAKEVHDVSNSYNIDMQASLKIV